ncbi:MAG: pyridoxamine 5-phosphate oxidase-related FMN-binding [Frankiales bacterium]|jgi:PPOX class probable F420-dependent enzyme|nr:pyridoxamine 5-phosphate oxidase-related FMN-binding [Frankiales bacterium]
MAKIDDPAVQNLLTQPNHGIVSTFDDDGSIRSGVVWVDLVDGKLALNSAEGRTWPTNLQRDPRVTVLVYDQNNPYEYVEVRGTATSSTADADGHIDRLAKKYLGKDSYPFRQEGEQRVSFFVDPKTVKYQKQ